MPCRDYEDSYSYNSNSDEKIRDLKKQNDRLARIACAAMTELEKLGKEDFLILKNEEVGTWWAKHKEADRLAQIAKAEIARKAKIKKDALAKLTDEEKKVLGIKK